jgi:hypothetical protein
MIICSLTINLIRQQDILVWVGMSNGEFSIKGANHLEKERALLNKRGSSSAQTHRNMWKGIMMINVPGVVKMFLWKA